MSAVETASRFLNGKSNRAPVTIAKLNAEVKALVEKITESDFDPNQILEVFANTGVQIHTVTIQNILARRAAQV